MKRILITGAAGFLGSHLCDRFIKEGYHVIGMDNLITGDLRNVEHLFPLPQFDFYHHDVYKFIHVSGPLDYILHFASPASPIDYLKIDGKLIHDGLNHHENENILGMIISLAKDSQIIVIADGVEHNKQKGLLKNLGCTIMQGKLFGSPQPAGSVGHEYHS